MARAALASASAFAAVSARARASCSPFCAWARAAPASAADLRLAAAWAARRDLSEASDIRKEMEATLDHAAAALRQSAAAREMFGDAFVEHYAASREWEEREFRKHITDWELERYFEII